MNIVGNAVEHYVLLVGACSSPSAAIGFLVRRNVLVQLMSIELMLNAVNLTLVAFNRVHAGDMNGQVFAFFIIAVAAAEAAVGLAIVLSFFRLKQTVVQRRGGPAPALRISTCTLSKSSFPLHDFALLAFIAAAARCSARS